MGELLDRVLLIASHIKRDDQRAAMVAFLIDIGIPTQLDGYENLIHAIMLYHGDPEMSFTKEIYPEVARMSRRKTGKKQVEKTIRYSIKTAWDLRDRKILNIYFPPDDDGKMRRPTNAEFISRLARILEFWESCYEEEGRNEKINI